MRSDMRRSIAGVALLLLVVSTSTLANERQGGDTLDDALVIASLPFAEIGTTIGYGADYHGDCDYPESGEAADVCFLYTPPADGSISIDLLGSDYDTTLFAYEVIGQEIVQIACDEDFHGNLTSRIDDLSVVAGHDYLIVVDGFGLEAGDYRIVVSSPTLATEAISWSRVRSLYR